MISNTDLAKETEAALKRVTTRALRSKRSSRALLQRAGILTKSGKLAKPYRGLDAALKLPNTKYAR